MTTIRPRLPADLDACVALIADVHRTDGYPAHWPPDPHRWLTPSRLLAAWVAEQDDGAIVGHVGLNRPDGDTTAAMWSERTGRPVTEAAVVTRLCVAESARGDKLGERLLARACAGTWHPVLDVLVDNVAAIALYDRLGWQRLASTDHTLPDGRVVGMFHYAAPTVR